MECLDLVGLSMAVALTSELFLSDGHCSWEKMRVTRLGYLMQVRAAGVMK